MRPTVSVPKYGRLARMGDRLMLPLMKHIALPGESPQHTHFWNNTRMPRAAINHLDRSLMVMCEGDPEAPPRKHRWDLRFHRGAWKNYVVLQPMGHGGKWNVGWAWGDHSGILHAPIFHRVRMLIGPEETEFFGISRATHEQIQLHEVGRGQLGDGGPFRTVPLY